MGYSEKVTGPRSTSTITAATHGAQRPPTTAHARYAMPEAIINLAAGSDPNQNASGSAPMSFNPVAKRA